MPDFSNLDFSKLNIMWITLVVGVFTGMCLIIAALIQSTARNKMKSLGIMLALLLATALIVAIFYVSGVIPPHLPTVVAFQARINRLVVYVYRNPNFDGSLMSIASNSIPIQVYSRVSGVTLPGTKTNVWYQVVVPNGDKEVAGYIFAELLDLTPLPDNPNATPPLVTLTPTVKP